jgi:monofunctional biosynthetic peptidoglycan transglycosylase
MKLQDSECELSVVYNKISLYASSHKFKFTVIYCLMLFYIAVPSVCIPYFQYGHTRISSLMQQRAIESAMVFYPQQKWVDIEDVNPDLLKCIVGMEDAKFFNHKGLDWIELEKSMIKNKKKHKVARGGSTLTMQLSKNLFMRTDRNVFRKAKEILVAVRMEKELGKKNILENYINVIEWGDGVFGIAEAAETYYNQKPSELSMSQCAHLAAVIPSPLRNKPTDNSLFVNKRAALIKSRCNVPLAL